MNEDQAGEAALRVEPVVEADAAEEEKPWWYAGGFKAEHRQTPVVKRSPYSTNEAYMALGRVLIPPAEKALLFVIFTKVDSKTWRWPPKHMELKRGSSVLELATLIGRSVRHTRRLLRKLEGRGVLITYDRRPYRSEYQIVPEVLMELGRMGHEDVRTVLATARDAAMASQAAADVHIDREASAPEPDAAPADDGAPAEASVVEAPEGEVMPRWVEGLARKNGLKPAFAAGLVRAAWRAAGEQGRWTVLGGEGRATVKAWRELGEPSLAEWEALLMALATAVKAGRLNGMLPRNWMGHPSCFVKLARKGAARQVAQAYVAATKAPPAAAVARASGTPGLARRASGNPGSVRIEGLALLPPMRTVERWNAEKAQVRVQLGALYDIWLHPLEWGGLDGDETVILAPNKIFGDWCAENYSAALTHMAGGPVRLKWEG